MIDELLVRACSGWCWEPPPPVLPAPLHCCECGGTVSRGQAWVLPPDRLVCTDCRVLEAQLGPPRELMEARARLTRQVFDKLFGEQGEKLRRRRQ